MNVAPLLAELAVPSRRPDALARVARLHGAGDLLVLVADPETGRPRPALGLPQTLPGTPRWRALLKACRQPGLCDVLLDGADGGDRLARTWTGAEGDTLAFLDPEPGCDPSLLAPQFDLAFALFRAELRADLAGTRALVAESATAQGAHLLAALEAARVQVAGKARDLAEALSATERANVALQRANACLDEERRAAEHAASTDALTGITSRSAFESRLSVAVAASAGGEPLSLLLFDLDDFKEINDTRGHAAGDAVLAAVGSRLREACAGAMTPGRLGGDEFAVLLPACGSDAAAAVADRIRAAIRRPVPFRGEDLQPRCTIGLASMPQDAASPAELLRKADIALYDAKRASKGTVGRFSAAVETLFDARLRAVTRLRSAIDDGRVAAHYQPKVALPGRRVVGYEALMRFHAEDGTLQGPGNVWPALSDAETLRHLGARMLDLVLADLSSCRAAGLPLPSVSLNVTGPEIVSARFAPAMLSRLADAGLPPCTIEIEITETALLGDHRGQARESLAALRAAGMTVALDDFGTGYSSLSYLLDWDVDCIKIDRSFIGDFAADSRPTRIVRSIVEMARGLGIAVVAEGVETAAQAEYLAAIGCPLAQGFLFGRAAPAFSLLGPPTAVRPPAAVGTPCIA